MSNYAIKGEHTGELLTYNGRVITYHNPTVLQWLFPKNEVIPVHVSFEDSFPLWAHPDVIHLDLERPRI